MMKLEEIFFGSSAVGGRPQNAIDINALNKLLKNATVKVGWYGRWISVKDVEGAVPIEKVWKTYRCISTDFFERVKGSMEDKNAPSPTLAERCKYYKCWMRIEELYRESDRQLSEMRIYKYVYPVLEGVGKLLSFSSYSIYLNRNDLFSFSPEEYQRRWPNIAQEEGQYGGAWRLPPGKINFLFGRTPESFYAQQQELPLDSLC